jgi:alkanesulfonate monooxygenase SsuD/methylene tetrahydromethanopterin reductase-like flavin-dependent oxidoreductase (luciferase family)
MKFGVSIPHFGRPVNLAALLEIVRQTEALGFDSVWVTDHVTAGDFISFSSTNSE